MLGMSESKIRVESYDPKTKLIKIKPEKSFDFKKDSELLYQSILNLAKVDKIRILLDLENITFPSVTFIAFMIEVSSFLKRKKGELLAVNLSDSARMNFVTFNPLNFINLVEKEILESAIKKEEKTKKVIKEKNRMILTDETIEIEESDLESEFSINDLVTSSEDTKKGTNSVKFDFAEVEEKKKKIKEVKSERIVVKSREDQLYKLTDFVAIHAENASFEPTEISRIKISVYEAAHNIIEHAYKFGTDKFIELNLKYDHNKFTINLMDKGKSFDYDPNRDYDAVEAAEERRTGGFGLHIIKRSMDDIQYESNPVWGNRLTLVKNVP